MVDVETSGPVYGRHSLVELGAAVGSRASGIVDRFSALISPIGDEAVQSRGTFRRAKEHGEAPSSAMTRLAEWSRPHTRAGAAFLARPAAFDWPWIVYYAWTFLGANPFGFKATCASSWLEGRGRRFRLDLPHVAVEDAALQLEYFLTHG